MHNYNRQGLSIILPVYNEEKNIKDIVIKIITNFKNYTNDFELILINDGSTDRTGDIITDLAGRYSTLRTITISQNKGYGAAIRAGIYNAQRQWLLIMDADGQTAICST